MKFKQIFVLIFIFVQAISTQAFAHIDEDEYISLGLESSKNDRYDDAIVYYLKVLEEYPKNENVRTLIAVAYRNIRFYSEAERYFKQQIELSPGLQSYGNLGSIYGELEYDTLAQQVLNKSLTFDDEYGYAHNNLGAIHIAFQRYDEAEPHLVQAILALPNLWNSHLNMAIIHNKREEYGLAKESLERCLLINPYCGNAKKLLSTVIEKMTGKEQKVKKGDARKELKESIELYTRSIKRNWYDAESVLNRARAYGDLGDSKASLIDYKNALARYNEIVADVPESREMRACRASIYTALRQYDLAIADYNYILKMYPTDQYTIDKIKEVEELKVGKTE